MKFHPLAELFPMFPENELKELADDIKQNGLRAPITLYEDKILDGRNRYLACKKARVEPKFRQHTGDPVAFVVSANLRRRHLNDSQRSVIAARLALGAFGADPTKKTRQVAPSLVKPLRRCSTLQNELSNVLRKY
jgi:hypothetical protein